MNLIIISSFIALQYFNVMAQNISTKKCNYFRNKFPQLSKVFNDDDYYEDVALTEFPFMARIESGTNYVNGILISEKFVLTVASYNFKAKQVVLGDLEMGDKKDDAHSQYLKVVDEFTHPMYSKDLTFDLKLLMLNGPVKFNAFIRPACLPQSATTISQQLMEIGWSKINFRGNSLLRKVEFERITNAMCQKKFKFIAQQKTLMQKIDKQTIFCAIAKEGDRDMCLGFLGAALVNHSPKSTLDEVIGFAISNTGCNDTYPTVFVRISSGLRWIESVVWPDEIQKKVDGTIPSTSATKLSSSKKSLSGQKVTSTSATKLSSSKQSLFEQNTILINVTTIPTITIISIMLSIAIVYLKKKRSQNDQEVNLNIQYGPER